MGYFWQRGKSYGIQDCGEAVRESLKSVSLLYGIALRGGDIQERARDGNTYTDSTEKRAGAWLGVHGRAST